MNPGTLKLNNRLNVLRELYLDPKSRVDLSRRLGLSKATISMIVDRLLSDGLVVETGVGLPGEAGGKKPIICAINPDYGYILAMHYDYVCCQIVLANLQGKILDDAKLDIRFFSDYRKTFDLMLDGAEALLARHPERLADGRLLACGIAATGLVDSIRGVLQYAASQKSWNDVPIRAYCSARLGTRVFVEHDARTLTYIGRFAPRDENEDMHGSIYIGDGVAAGVIIGNSVIRGAHYGAVNFTHTIVDPSGPECKCGKHGCWEAFVRTDNFARVVSERLGGGRLSFDQAVELYREGNPAAAEVVSGYYSHWVGVGVSNFITTFNPRTLTIYGDGRLFDAAAQERMRTVVASLSSSVARKTEIRFDTDIDYVYVNGTIGMVLRNFLSPEHHESFLLGRTAAVP